MRLPGILRATALAAGVAVSSGNAAAFDYQDGTEVRDAGAADIASLYAFVPNDGGEAGPLTVLLSIKPFALSIHEVGRMTDFTSVTEYTVRIRPAALAGTGNAVRTLTGSAELAIACRYFDDAHEISCIASQHTPDGERVVGHAGGDLGEDIKSKGLRVMTQMRSDPMLANFHSEFACLDTDELEYRKLGDFERRVHVKFRNSVEFNKMNVISLAMEIDREWLPKETGKPLLAIAADSVIIDHDGNQTRADRVGRPGVATRLIQDDASRNGWNTVAPFDGASASGFRESMQLGMTAVDSQSRVAYWDRPHPLLELMLSDYLLLNPNVASAPLDTSRNNYFELEWAAYTGQSMDGLPGGRRLVDNVQSRFYAVFARQGKSHFDQLENLKHPLYRPTYSKFPYMAAPYEKHDTLLSRMTFSIKPPTNTIHGCER